MDMVVGVWVQKAIALPLDPISAHFSGWRSGNVDPFSLTSQVESLVRVFGVDFEGTFFRHSGGCDWESGMSVR